MKISVSTEYARFRHNCSSSLYYSCSCSRIGRNQQDCLESSKFLNDHIADLVARYPKNYIGLGTIPMQDVDTAIQELRRCKEIGLVGVQIGSNINDKNLGEPEFYPIFEAMAELGMAVMIHPWQMMGEDSMKKYWLPWLVGMPAETSRAACSMIFSGLLEKLPHLRVCFSHAGGSFLTND
jgi:aminocarboxymuconate-semialdehyde decarboxylase